MVGGLGVDTDAYASAGAGVVVNLATTTAQNTGAAGTDTASGFENLTGSAFDDTLTGDGSANVIDGGAGNDTLIGGAGMTC
jgi:Ca2+-binding RTX toxin-like protein